MFTPAAIIVMSVTRSPLAPRLIAESESDPPSVVVDSIVVVSSSPESGDEGVGPGEGVGSIVVVPDSELEMVADVVGEVGGVATVVVGIAVGSAQAAQHSEELAYLYTVGPLLGQIWVQQVLMPCIASLYAS